jgi:long-subunit fatty acid transport protein
MKVFSPKANMPVLFKLEGPGVATPDNIVNTTVANELRAVSSFRFGGEYRIERFSLRAGYHYEESPLNSSNAAIGDGHLEGISGGIGYNFGSSRLDLAINRTERDMEQGLFDTGINTPALVNGVSANGTLSYTINF